MMNRRIIVLFAVVLSVMLCMTVGCGGGSDVGDTVGGVGQPSEEQLAALQEIYGFSDEELAAMPAEKLEALLAEVGYITPPDRSENENGGNDRPSSNRLTYDDLTGDGSYVMTVGDSMMWNYIEFYYENGKLVKIVMHFSKDGSEEDTEIMTYEEEEIADCNVFDIDYNADPESVAAQLKEKMYYDSVYIEPVR